MSDAMMVSSTRAVAFASAADAVGRSGRRPASARGPVGLGEDTVTLSPRALGRNDVEMSDEDSGLDESTETSEAGDGAAEVEGEDATDASQTELTEQEHAEVKELEARDAEVRRHEMAHAAAGGQYAGSPNYEFETGPDGRRYAVGGHVNIDVGEVPGEPERTIEKMRVVRAAALAPSEPSGQDRRVAAEASKKEAAARAELAEQEQGEAPAHSSRSEAAETQDVDGRSDATQMVEAVGRSEVSARALLAERQARRGYAEANRALASPRTTSFERVV